MPHFVPLSYNNPQHLTPQIRDYSLDLVFRGNTATHAAILRGVQVGPVLDRASTSTSEYYTY
jgi:hypothetical protein